jgi:hypothetical protein
MHPCEKDAVLWNISTFYLTDGRKGCILILEKMRFAVIDTKIIGNMAKLYG